jgi:hypothetical protein
VTLDRVLSVVCFAGVLVAETVQAPVSWQVVILAVIGLAPVWWRLRHERTLAELRHEQVMARLGRTGRDARVGRRLAEGLYLERAAAVPELAGVLPRFAARRGRRRGAAPRPAIEGGT